MTSVTILDRPTKARIPIRPPQTIFRQCHSFPPTTFTVRNHRQADRRGSDRPNVTAAHSKTRLHRVTMNHTPNRRPTARSAHRPTELRQHRSKVRPTNRMQLLGLAYETVIRPRISARIVPVPSLTASPADSRSCHGTDQLVVLVAIVDRRTKAPGHHRDDRAKYCGLPPLRHIILQQHGRGNQSAESTCRRTGRFHTTAATARSTWSTIRDHRNWCIPTPRLTFAEPPQRLRRRLPIEQFALRELPLGHGVSGVRYGRGSWNRRGRQRYSRLHEPQTSYSVSIVVSAHQKARFR